MKTQKLLDILIGRLISSAEDLMVKPEHRKDNDYWIPPEGATFNDIVLAIVECEAGNCQYTLTQFDKDYILAETHRVASHVRK